VKSTVLVENEAALRPAVLPEKVIKSDAGGRGLENLLAEHLGAIAAVVVAAGFGLRLLVASRSYLNPDEALHYVMFNQQSTLLTYQVSLTSAHPPLFFLFMYFWHFLGRSELLLRLPSVLAGTAFCWFTFKWVGLFFGKKPGLISLVIATFAPALINISAEVRQYAFLLLFMSVALYFLGRSFQEKSSRDMWYFTLFLYLAIL
jgi:mannosyltransferase